LCFERRFSKQNSVIRLKFKILAPPKFLVWLRHCSGFRVPFKGLQFVDRLSVLTGQRSVFHPRPLSESLCSDPVPAKSMFQDSGKREIFETTV